MANEQTPLLPAYYYFYSHLGRYLSKNGLSWPYGLAYEGQQQESLRRREKKKSFLIDDILASDKEEEAEERADVDELSENYSWLQCTRYRPPKIPRSPKKEGTGKKRKLGRNPRVPFTQHQVSTLEQKFRGTHYLSSLDVAELSAGLNLTETRVKIWFQNRRARERREREHVRPPVTQGSPSPSAHINNDDSWLVSPSTNDDLDTPTSTTKFSADDMTSDLYYKHERPAQTYADVASTALVADLNAQWVPANPDHNPAS